MIVVRDRSVLKTAMSGLTGVQRGELIRNSANAANTDVNRN